jgi:hypothetical protein
MYGTLQSEGPSTHGYGSRMRLPLALMTVAALGWSLISAQTSAAVVQPGTCQDRVVDFAGLPAGTALDQQLAADGIHMSAVAYQRDGERQRPDKLIVFDSNASGTPDPDMEAGIGNLAIIAENDTDSNGDGLVDVPNDSIRGGKQIYTFDHDRSVNSFVIVDIDHRGIHSATAFDADGNVIVSVPIPVGAEGNVQTIQMNADGVRRLEISYSTSAGVTEISLDCSPTGGEGCTPGFWKQAQHFDAWTDPYDPSDPFSDHFENAFPGKTLLQVLQQGDGGLDALGRHTVSALLNAASPGVDFAFTRAQVIARFNEVFPGTTPAYEALKSEFEAENERGCGLN